MGKKIGRNEPCPCNSGKKYKKCCYLKDFKNNSIALHPKVKHEPFFKRDASESRTSPVSRYETIYNEEAPPLSPLISEGYMEYQTALKLTTEEFLLEFQQLFHRSFTVDDFRKIALTCNSESELIDKWSATAKRELRIYDFFWHAASILWDRLLPEHPSFTALSDRFEKIFSLTQKEQAREFLNILEIVKDRLGEKCKFIQHLDEMYDSAISIDAVLGDILMDLSNHDLYLDIEHLCSTILDWFPKLDGYTRVYLKRQIAEAQYGKGDHHQGNKLFEDLVSTYPSDAWNYIIWGDMYWSRRIHESISINRKKAESIYMMGREKVDNIEDLEIIKKRLEKLQSQGVTGENASK